MRPPVLFTLCLTPLLLLSCSTAARVSSQPKSILQKYRKVAVVAVDVTIIRQRAQKSETGDRLRKYIALADEYIYRALSRAFGEDVRLGTGRDGYSDPEANLEELAIEIVNRNLLEKGFLPVERRQMRLIMRELSRSQSGLFDPATRQEIGRLASVDAIYHGRILVGVEKGLFSLKTRVTFNGRIMSVREGFVIASGESTRRSDEFKPQHMGAVIDGWFDDIPRI